MLHLQSGISVIGLPRFLKRLKMSAKLAAVQKLYAQHEHNAKGRGEGRTIAALSAAPFRLVTKMSNQSFGCKVDKSVQVLITKSAPAERR